MTDEEREIRLMERLTKPSDRDLLMDAMVAPLRISWKDVYTQENLDNIIKFWKGNSEENLKAWFDLSVEEREKLLDEAYAKGKDGQVVEINLSKETKNG